MVVRKNRKSKRSLRINETFSVTKILQSLPVRRSIPEQPVNPFGPLRGERGRK